MLRRIPSRLLHPGRPWPIPIVLLLIILNLSCEAPRSGNAGAPGPRNIILFVADGAGPTHVTMGREFARHLGLRDRLYLDAHLVGTVRTHSAAERVTDSASSATAYATGYKTYNGAISVDTLRRPLRTILEAAEADGLATGLVVSSRITHATPAAFAAHVADREEENEIAAQMIDQGVDVLLGGGRRHFRPRERGGARSDGRDLLTEAADMGYHVVSDSAELSAADTRPLLGLFSEDHIPYEIDQPPSESPDLSAMTRKAIELLGQDEDGFFLLVEGSRIDHASHENDVPAALRELLAYDEAFETARRFAENDGSTLLIAVSDHETGGLAAGRLQLPTDNAELDERAPTFRARLHGTAVYDWRPDLLARVSSSAAAMADSISAGADARTLFQDTAGITDLSAEETAAVEVARADHERLVTVLGEIVARRAVAGWTTTGHTAVDVNLYAFGPESAAIRGNVDNTYIGERLFDILDATMGTLEAAP